MRQMYRKRIVQRPETSGRRCGRVLREMNDSLVGLFAANLDEWTLVRVRFGTTLRFIFASSCGSVAIREAFGTEGLFLAECSLRVTEQTNSGN